MKPVNVSPRGPWAAHSVHLGPPRKLGNTEIALAMELRGEGVRTKWIAKGLDVDPHYLARTLSRARRYGMIPDA